MGRIPTIYYCTYENCTASFDRKHRFETHIRSHTGERPFICSHESCGKSFISSSHLKRHEDTHGSSCRCTVENCFAVLKTKATLNKHMKRVHIKINSKKQKKVYTCTQCGKNFNKHNTLQNHELRHSGQLPHKCSVEDCGKAFLTPSKLKRHMKIHEGYPCKVPSCDKVFEKWSLYVRHVRDSHRPEYKCPKCSKTFTRSSYLKLHVPFHEESRLAYPCQVPNCSRYYFEEKNLRWHVREYHEKRPFICDKENCYMAFRTEADLADHILYHGQKKPRKKKNKPKKLKPSLAEILSGVAEVKQVCRKSKQDSTEVKESETSPSSSKLNLSELELDITKISFIGSEEPNQSSLKEENPCVLTDERNVSCASSESISVESLLGSSRLNISNEIDASFSLNNNDGTSVECEAMRLLSKDNILEIEQSTTAEELDSLHPTENLIVPMECEINKSSTELKVPESAIQEYTTIEVIGSGNLPQLIYVPIIQVDDKNWNKNVAVHIETLS